MKQLWPSITKAHPKSKLYLVLGGNSDKYRTHLKNVINSGYVPDIYSVLRNSNLMLAPALSGTGIKVKVIEGFAFGIPVLTNTRGLRNFDGIDTKRLIVAETAEEQILAIDKIMQARKELKKISEYQKAYYNEMFTQRNILLYKKFYYG